MEKKKNIIIDSCFGRKALFTNICKHCDRNEMGAIFS
jgi:hypothetical protein